MVQELPIEKLHRTCEPSILCCESSAELSPLSTIIGQERAVRALKFGLGIKERGFNIYVAGRPGTGRTTAVENFLEEVAKSEPTPSDWCYVNHFSDTSRPNAIRLPAGRGAELKADMDSLLGAAVREISNAFDSEEYALQKENTLKTFQQQKQSILSQINEQALQSGFVIQPSAVGLLTIPIKNGKPMSEDDFMALKPEQREAINQKQEQVNAALEAAIRQAKGLDKGAEEAMQKLDRQVGEYAIRHQFADLKDKYAGLDEVLTFLEHVQNDILDNLANFKPQAEEQPALPIPGRGVKESPTRKYQVNVLVDNSRQKGAPVVLERNPTYANLFGRVEQEAQFGTLVTDFTLIRSGSLHRANGGYLVLPMEDVLRNPLTWDSLKRALENGEIVIEDVGEKIGLIFSRSLRPEPIPLSIKIILIGRLDVYQLLLAYDDNFNELFKVKVDFDTSMPWTDENAQQYASFVSMICETEKLHHLEAAALALLVEHGARLAEDQEKLSTHFGVIADVIREASYYASLEQAEAVGAAHVRKAIDERFYRSSLVHERIKEMMQRDVIKIDVGGQQVGQVNGLSVIQWGDLNFGQPNRITVSVGLGREGLVDIEREAQLGGPIHTKGVLILSGYLTEKYAQDKPLSLSARLVFEQSYSGVEGDSASSTELYAILSALAGLPIRQGIAVTGSVNQKGEVQAIGGVNEKIEGFFAICQAKGLTGEQGVMIPESNVANLMLKDDVLQAVRDGQFRIWPVRTIDEGIEILTGVKGGECLPDGGFEEGSVNARVDGHLKALADKLAQFGRPPEHQKRSQRMLRKTSKPKP
jgi:lon-related putative ATP-dependent protease